MRKNSLLIIMVLFFMACETGTRYDKNETIKAEVPSEVVNRTYTNDIEALLKDRNRPEVEEQFDDDLHPIVLEEDRVLIDEETDIKRSFSGGKIADRLDVRSIREGLHDGFVRLVFDVYDNDGAALNVGAYNAKYRLKTNDIVVVINGYRKFSAPLPSFSSNSAIEQIYFEKYTDDSAYKFHIKLRNPSEVRVFDLKNPARLVFDIKAI